MMNLNQKTVQSEDEDVSEVDDESEDEDESKLDEFEKLVRKYQREAKESEGFDIETCLDIDDPRARPLFGVIRKLDLDANDAGSLCLKFECMMALKYTIKTENLKLENIIKANYETMDLFYVTFRAIHPQTHESKIYQAELHFNIFTGVTSPYVFRPRKDQKLTDQETLNMKGDNLEIFPNPPQPVVLREQPTDTEGRFIMYVCNFCCRYALVQEEQKQGTRNGLYSVCEAQYIVNMPKISFRLTFAGQELVTYIRRVYEAEVILDTINWEPEVLKITDTGKLFTS